MNAAPRPPFPLSRTAVPAVNTATAAVPNEGLVGLHPESRRWVVRARLRAARLVAGLTHDDVAAALRHSARHNAPAASSTSYATCRHPSLAFSPLQAAPAHHFLA